jgi:hypothetical protein
LLATVLRARDLAIADAIDRVGDCRGGAVFGVSLVLALSLFETPRRAALWIASLAGGGAVRCLRRFANRPASLLDAARMIEGRAPSFDNLIVTAAELAERPRPVRAEIRDEIVRQAVERLPLRRCRPRRPTHAAVRRRAGGCGRLRGAGGKWAATRWRRAVAVTPLNAAATIGHRHFKVTVSPPSYLRRNIEVFDSPVADLGDRRKPRAD